MMRGALSSLCLVGALLAQTGFVGDSLGRGSVNYSDRKIQATGIGYIPENVINAGQARRAALRIAKQDALRQMVEIVNGVTLTSETTMDGAMLDDVVKTRVEGAIRGAQQVGEPKYLSDTSIEVLYEVPMSGISEILLPGARPPAAAGTAPTSEAPPAATAIPPGSPTGLIVDARGLKIRPALSPRILDQNGGEVYGPGQFTRAYAVANGVAGYSKGMEKAMQDARVKGNPIVVKGVAAAGSNQVDVVIASGDVPKIQAANQAVGILRDCRVLIVVD